MSRTIYLLILDRLFMKTISISDSFPQLPIFEGFFSASKITNLKTTRGQHTARQLASYVQAPRGSPVEAVGCVRHCPMTDSMRLIYLTRLRI